MKKDQASLILLFTGTFALSLQLATADYHGSGDVPGTVPPPTSPIPTTSPTDVPGATPILACEIELRVATLTGADEVPAVQTDGSGAASFAIRNRNEIFFSVAATDLTSNINAAHIHIGALGVNGPIIFPLASSGFENSISGVLRESDFVPAPEQGINTFQDALDAVMNGSTYVNVHTTNNPDGEIRGQIRQAQSG